MIKSACRSCDSPEGPMSVLNPWTRGAYLCAGSWEVQVLDSALPMKK
jgi:hypothetical protein